MRRASVEFCFDLDLDLSSSSSSRGGGGGSRVALTTVALAAANRPPRVHASPASAPRAGRCCRRRFCRRRGSGIGGGRLGEEAGVQLDARAAPLGDPLGDLLGAGVAGPPEAALPEAEGRRARLWRRWKQRQRKR